VALFEEIKMREKIYKSPRPILPLLVEAVVTRRKKTRVVEIEANAVFFPF